MIRTKRPATARKILARVEQEAPAKTSHAIMDMVFTIISHKFEKLSRKEVETMLGITLKETRVYQEIKEEGREEARQETAESVLRTLEKRFGSIPENLRADITVLSLSRLNDLMASALDFSSVDDVRTWLGTNQNS